MKQCFLLFSFCLLILIGCDTQVGQIVKNDNNLNNSIKISDISTIPTFINKPSYFSLAIINNANQHLSNINFDTSTSDIKIINSNCSSLLINGNCKVNFYKNISDTKSALIKVTAVDDNGNNYQSQQLVNFDKYNLSLTITI